jgi:hypothetical protein
MFEQDYSTPAWAMPESDKQARQVTPLTTEEILPALTGWPSRKLRAHDAAARQAIKGLLDQITGLQARLDEATRVKAAADSALEGAREQIARMGPVYNGHDAAMIVATAIAAETGRCIVKSTVLDGIATYHFSDGTLVRHTLADYGPHRVVIDADGGSLTLDEVSPTGKLTTAELALVTMLMAGLKSEPSSQDKPTDVDFDVVLVTCADANCPWCNRLRDQSSSFGPTVSFRTLLESVLPHYDFSSSAWPEGGPHFPFGFPGSDTCGSC